MLRKLPKNPLRKLAFLSTLTMAPRSSTTAGFATSSSMSPKHTTAPMDTDATTALDKARQLVLPTREEMLRRDAKVYDFWNSNEQVLEDAWKEWNDKEGREMLPPLDSSLINPKLREAVEAAWKNPSEENEAAIKSLWDEVAPGVYAIQFFDLEQLEKLRSWFDTTATAGIPTRPPYGIVLNRRGVMTDPRSVGYLAAPDFQTFYKLLVEDYVRPLGRLFWPEHIRETDDDESFSFSIQYQGEQGGDKSIRHHTDASTVTFNINLDTTKTWTGSSLIFFPKEDGVMKRKPYGVNWSPGIAVMHLGKTMHAALPIESGTRSNWVIWTMGKRGQYSYGGGNPLTDSDGCYEPEYQLSPEQRWTKQPEEAGSKPEWSDRWSPF